jgi:hypothetical protein
MNRDVRKKAPRRNLSMAVPSPAPVAPVKAPAGQGLLHARASTPDFIPWL